MQDADGLRIGVRNPAGPRYAGVDEKPVGSRQPPILATPTDRTSLLRVAEAAIVFTLVAATPGSDLDCLWTRKGLVSMRLTWRKREPESVANSTALVVIELPADELLVEEPASDELPGEPRRRAGVLARSRSLARRLNPAAPARIALGRSGRAAKAVVVKLRLRRLARAIREFRRIGSTDFARLADGVGRRAKGMGSRLSLISPRKARSVRVVTTALRRLVRNISPSVATRVARETTQSARATIAKLDPRRVEDAVRRVAETIDLDGTGEKGKPSGRYEVRWDC